MNRFVFLRMQMEIILINPVGTNKYRWNVDAICFSSILFSYFAVLCVTTKDYCVIRNLRSLLSEILSADV